MCVCVDWRHLAVALFRALQKFCWSARHCVRLDKGTTDGMRFIMKVYPPQQSGIPKLMSLYARVCVCVCVCVCRVGVICRTKLGRITRKIERKLTDVFLLVSLFVC